MASLIPVLVAAATGTLPAEEPPEAPAAVLFVGNSLTAYNDLAGKVSEIAAEHGRRVHAEAVTMAGASLDDHLADGRAVRAIRRRRWDFVVLQQGPSTLPASRESLIASARKLAEEVRRGGGRPALLMVWPLRHQTFDAVSASYRAAAEAVPALLCPAGEAWQRVLRREPSLPLFGPDGFHPAPLGTYLAAMSVECALFGESPSPPRGLERLGVALTGAQKSLLHEVACRAAPVPR